MTNSESDRPQPHVSVWAILVAFLALGLTSFGGPIAHLGYFRNTFVSRKRWLDERSFADLVALCQVLPGPTSSQVGMGIGLTKAGWPGMIAAWLGFTLPSAIAMTVFGYGTTAYHDAIPPGLLHGLKIVAVAVVAQAVYGMARTLCPDWRRRGLALAAALAVLVVPIPAMQIVVIAIGALAGLVLLRSEVAASPASLAIPLSKRLGLFSIALFFVLLFGLPVLAPLFPSQTLALIERFYRAGALVFGGGHVVLPLLQSAVVPPGWVSNESFLAGYGAAQAVPGPLFTFASYLGAVMEPPPQGWAGSVICTLAIFAPSFLLMIGILPFWAQLRDAAGVQNALQGVNATVVGLLLAALYTPVATSALLSPGDFALALADLALLMLARVPPVAIVGLSAAAGWLMSI